MGAQDKTARDVLADSKTAFVCSFHRDKKMAPHTTTDFVDINGRGLMQEKEVKGYHCPRCFKQNSGILVVLDE